MTMQTASLSALEASAANPRRKIDRKSIEGLAASSSRAPLSSK
jgi:hypothetical protein